MDWALCRGPIRQHAGKPFASSSLQIEFGKRAIPSPIRTSSFNAEREFDERLPVTLIFVLLPSLERRIQVVSTDEEIRVKQW